MTLPILKAARLQINAYFHENFEYAIKSIILYIVTKRKQFTPYQWHLQPTIIIKK
jgi:hypothetical protein